MLIIVNKDKKDILAILNLIYNKNDHEITEIDSSQYSHVVMNDFLSLNECIKCFESIEEIVNDLNTKNINI